MDNNTFLAFLNDAKLNNKILYHPPAMESYQKIIDLIYKDVEQFDIYSLDGQFQDILIKVVNNFQPIPKVNLYESFLDKIYQEFKNIVVPVIILIPLNNLKILNIKEDYINLADNIRIYKALNLDKKQILENRQLKKNKDIKTPLSEYVEKSIYATLNIEHILLAKDPSFFNYPILSILVNNIDYKVEYETTKISEAVYSLIRMIDFDAPREGHGWGLFESKLKYPAKTFVVNYNDHNTSPNPPYDSGYGSSYIFKFDAMLDINSNIFFDRIEKFKEELQKFINISFLDKTHIDDKLLKQKIKWQNAILLFNTAYELAAKEKYDVAVITLLTILESLFVKNKGSKKEQLIDKVPKFLIRNGFKFDKETLENVIRRTYDMRNDFVHEGKGYYNHNTVKGINDKQGIIPCMKPFAYDMLPSIKFDDAKDIHMLFRTVIYVLLTDDDIN